jgi:hypothetical protein
MPGFSQFVGELFPVTAFRGCFRRLLYKLLDKEIPWVGMGWKFPEGLRVLPRPLEGGIFLRHSRCGISLFSCRILLCRLAKARREAEIVFLKPLYMLLVYRMNVFLTELISSFP